MNAHQVSANCDPVSMAAAPETGPLPSGRWDWRKAWASRRCAQLLTAVFSILLLSSVRRTLRIPNGYAKGHWLHNYKHGFVPRGLVGELLYPIVQYKNVEEVNGIISLFAWGVLAALCGLMVYGARRILEVQRMEWRRVLFVAALCVFATSPFVVMTGHLVGYFDHIIQGLGVLGVLSVANRKYLLAGFLCSLAILIHEMFVVTVMPALFFVTLVSIQGESGRGKTKALVSLLALPVITALIVAKTGTGVNNVAGLTADIARYGVVDHPQMNTVHISHGFRFILDSMLPTTMVRVTRDNGPIVMWPALLVLIIAGLVWRVRGYGLSLRIVFTLTSLTPLVMLITVWDADTSRIAAMTQFCCFCSLVGLAALDQRSQIELPRRFTNVRQVLCLSVFSVFAGAVTLWQIERETWLMDYELDRQTLLGTRRIEVPSGYSCDQLMFDNSNFEKGNLGSWTLRGTAFAYQPVDRQPGLWARRPFNEGKFWIGSFDRKSVAGHPMVQGDEPTGSLESRSFVITRPFMNFLIGGGADRKSTYVALDIDGRQDVYRTSGLNNAGMRVVVWDLRPFYGHHARVRIVDRSSVGWGHISADGFCYVDEQKIEHLPVVAADRESVTDGLGIKQTTAASEGFQAASQVNAKLLP